LKKIRIHSFISFSRSRVPSFSIFILFGCLVQNIWFQSIRSLRLAHLNKPSLYFLYRFFLGSFKDEISGSPRQHRKTSVGAAFVF
jgi:hypothetical protein